MLLDWDEAGWLNPARIQASQLGWDEKERGGLHQQAVRIALYLLSIVDTHALFLQKQNTLSRVRRSCLPTLGWSSCMA